MKVLNIKGPRQHLVKSCWSISKTMVDKLVLKKLIVCPELISFYLKTFMNHKIYRGNSHFML